MSPKLSKKRKIINIKNKYHDVLSYMIDSYYENNNTIFTVKYISVNTGVNLSIIKDVLSLLDRTKIVTALPFKLSYKEVLKLEKIKEQYYSKTLSLVNIVIAVGAFLVTFGVGLFTMLICL